MPVARAGTASGTASGTTSGTASARGTQAGTASGTYPVLLLVLAPLALPVAVVSPLQWQRTVTDTASASGNCRWAMFSASTVGAHLIGSVEQALSLQCHCHGRTSTIITVMFRDFRRGGHRRPSQNVGFCPAPSASASAPESFLLVGLPKTVFAGSTPAELHHESSEP